MSLRDDNLAPLRRIRAERVATATCLLAPTRASLDARRELARALLAYAEEFGLELKLERTLDEDDVDGVTIGLTRRLP